MFSNNLIPTCCDEEQHIMDYKFAKSKTGICNVCSSNCNISYTTYILDDKICTKTCYLCHIVMNFKKYHTNKIFLIKSEMSQLQIIQSILDSYNNYRQILSPNACDNKCKLVKNLKLHDYMRNPNNYPNIKIYFNPNVLGHLVDLTQNMFCKQKFETDTSLSNYSYVIKFYDELNNLKTYSVNNKYNSEIDENIAESEKSFNQKYEKLQFIKKLKEKLLF